MHSSGTIYTVVTAAIMILLGFLALLDISGVAGRSGLQIVGELGRISMISSMGMFIGIGICALVILQLSGSWYYSTALLVTVLASVMLFRILGIILTGDASGQFIMLGSEILSVAIGSTLLLFGSAQEKTV